MAKSSAKLSEYRRKRDAARTNEPSGAEPTLSGSESWSGRFVIHLHDATRRHYDVRLEVGGVLESFAVPRGPSLDPADRRLAVHTERHPIDYLDFEAVIPEGNYGAGPMIVWDTGQVRYLERSAEAGLAAGKLDFELSGYKLHGRYGLVAIKSNDRGARGDRSRAQGGDSMNGGWHGAANPGTGKEWLLLKKTDGYSRTDVSIIDREPHSILSGLTVDEFGNLAEVRRSLAAAAESTGAPVGDWEVGKMVPMLCATDGGVLRAPGWIYELKLDGVRIVADKRGDDVALWSRSGISVTGRYPEVARALRALATSRAVVDGEIVAFDERGMPSFGRLAHRMHVTRPADVRIMAQKIPCVFVAFDLLALEGRDLRSLPLLRRKELLSLLVRGRGVVRALDHLENDGTPLFEFSRAHKLEGIVAKNGAAAYRPGPRRTGDWVKMKAEREDDFVVIGFTRGEGARARLGAIDVASYEGDELVVRGKVGSGFDDASIEATLALLEPLHADSSQARGELEQAPRGRTFVLPKVVVNVRYIGWTEEGRLRAPVFRGVRDDVPPASCKAAPRSPEEIDLAAAEATPDTQTGPEPPAPAAAPRERDLPSRVQVSNRSKIFWPDEGITKGQLCDYYADIADGMLPYLQNRPVVLVRYPDGIAGKNFYQWNAPGHIPSWVRTLEIEHEGRKVHTFLVDDRDALLYIANLGAIPIHIIAARSPHLGECDFVTFDFDVERATLADGIVLARDLREILESIGLEGFAKTSGQSGLHVLVPVGPGISFATARAFADLLGQMLCLRHPEIATMERRIADRGARVYVDTGQTGRSRTIVAPYSVRAQPGATISTPLEWDDVGPSLDPRRFDLFTVPERLRSRGDPMLPMLDARPDMRAALVALEKRVRPAGQRS